MCRNKVVVGSLIVLILAIILLFIMSVKPTTSITTLANDWQYYKNDLITGPSNHIKDDVVNIPFEFKDTGVSYATFIKTLHFSPTQIGQIYALHVPYQYSATNVYIDGQLKLQVGRVATSSEAHETDLKSQILPFEVTSDSMTVALQVSSFEHIRAAFANVIQLGTYDEILQAFIFERLIIALLAGVIILTGIVTILIGIYKKEEKLFFIFGLFCFLIATRAIFGVPFVYHIMPFDISYLTATRIEYLTTILAFLLYVMFIAQIYKELFVKWLLNVCYVVAIIVVGAILLTKPLIFQQIFFNIFPLIAIVITYVCYIVVKAKMQKRDLAQPLLIGITFVFIGLVIDFVTGAGYAYFPPLSLFTISANVAIVASSLSRNYVQQLDTIKNLNTELEYMNSSLNNLVFQRTEQLNLANTRLVELAEKDSLTGIYNRRKLNELLAQQCRVDANIVTVFMLDIDDFKKYNDYYGHLAGDEILIRFVKIVETIIPNESIFARYGGEEFVIVLQNNTRVEGYEIAERIRQAIEAQQIEHLGSKYGILTVSIGIATSHEMDGELLPNRLLKIADDNLYKSKNNGRNRVTITEENRCAN